VDRVTKKVTQLCGLSTNSWCKQGGQAEADEHMSKVDLLGRLRQEVVGKTVEDRNKENVTSVRNRRQRESIALGGYWLEVANTTKTSDHLYVVF